MNARCLASSRWRGSNFGLTILEAETMQKRDRPRAAIRTQRSEFRCDPSADLTCRAQQQSILTQAMSLACCSSFSAQALPPASERRQHLAGRLRQTRNATDAPYRRRETAPERPAHKLISPSSKTKALARRAKQFVTEPSRASAISAERSQGDKKPAQIMPPDQIQSPAIGKHFSSCSNSRGISSV